MRRTKMHNNRGTQLMSIPIQFHIGSNELNWQIVHEGGVTFFAGSCFTAVPLENIRLGDGWELVRQYLSATPGDEQSVLEFLVAHGTFEAPKGSITTTGVEITQLPVRRVWRGEDESRPRHVEMVVESFSLQEFAMIQDYVRRMLITGNPTLPTQWAGKDIQRYEITFLGARSVPEAHVIVKGTFPSILATVQFKLAQGAKFRTCARKDCRLPFEVTSRHTRRFCTQYCAHITSLRQRRKVGRRKEVNQHGSRHLAARRIK
jgi:hypothetical protein